MVAPHPEMVERTTRLLAALAEEQHLPAQALRHQLDEYPETIRVFLVCSFEDEGLAGFLDAFRLVDLLENLGCRQLAVPTPDRLDPVCVVGRRRDGKGFCVEVSRGARALDRAGLARILKESLGIERPTRAVTVVRSREMEADRRWTSPKTEVEAAAGMPPADLVLSGKLSEMPFADLVQLLALQRKTGALRFGRDGRQVGTIYFKEGAVVHAACRGGIEGEAAFLRCAALGEAFFAFTTETPPMRTIRRHTTTLLIDAMRAVDEAG